MFAAGLDERRAARHGLNWSALLDHVATDGRKFAAVVRKASRQLPGAAAAARARALEELANGGGGASASAPGRQQQGQALTTEARHARVGFERKDSNAEEVQRMRDEERQSGGTKDRPPRRAPPRPTAASTPAAHEADMTVEAASRLILEGAMGRFLLELEA